MSFEQIMAAHTDAINRYCDLFGNAPPPLPVVAQPEPEAQPQQPQQEAAPLTMVDVKDALIQVVKAKGRDKVTSLLDRFDVEKATQLTAEQYDGFVSACNEELAA